jgi:hypothetical protein
MLPSAAVEVLEFALVASPLDDGDPVTTWTVADRSAHAARLTGQPRHGLSQWLRLGYRCRRPRHDLHRRQDAEAVAGAKHVLSELKKRRQLPELDFGLFTWMSATCTPIPTWQRSGSGAAGR